LNPEFLSTHLLEEGRAAALAGHRAAAIRALQHYLALRYDPEPSVRPEVEAVRSELARLVGAGVVTAMCRLLRPNPRLGGGRSVPQSSGMAPWPFGAVPSTWAATRRPNSCPASQSKR